MAKQVITIRCPVCGWHHAPVKKGSKRRLRGEAVDGQERVFTFEKVNPDKDAFLSVRLAGGRGKGFDAFLSVRLAGGRGKGFVEASSICEGIFRIKGFDR